jgi:hypothetical protein
VKEDELKVGENLFAQKLLGDNVSSQELSEMLKGMNDSSLNRSFAYDVLNNLRNSLKLTEA